MPSLSDPVISISGLGQKTSDRLNQLGIHNLEHLLFHLPDRYQDKTSITPLSLAKVSDEILIEMSIDRIEVVPSRQRQLLCYLLIMKINGSYYVFFTLINIKNKPLFAVKLFSVLVKSKLVGKVWKCIIRSIDSLRKSRAPF